MSLESSKYTVYEEDGFVEVCVKYVNGTIRRAIPVTLSTATITAGMCLFCLCVCVFVIVSCVLLF